MPEIDINKSSHLVSIILQVKLELYDLQKLYKKLSFSFFFPETDHRMDNYSTNIIIQQTQLFNKHN